MTVGLDYSGIILNQNTLSSGQYPWRTDGTLIYQNFQLPADYTRGASGSEVRVPDLSGIQVLVTIDVGYAINAAIAYNLEVQLSGGWVSLVTGTAIGAPTDGLTWFDIIFPASIPVTSVMETATWRIGMSVPSLAWASVADPVVVNNNTYTINGQVIAANLEDGIPYPIVLSSAHITVGLSTTVMTNVPAFLLQQPNGVVCLVQQGINSISYVSATSTSNIPPSQRVYQSDGTTNLLSPAGTLNFRALALTADSGTDFLGNGYRSCVILTGAQNVTSTDGQTPVIGSGEGLYWMSSIYPSPFAVDGLYFDMRPIDTSGDPVDSVVVVDGVIVDPITPNMQFNVYYSTDDSYNAPVMTVDDWEQKLWYRVPQVFTCTTRKEYVLPSPVAAKYIKIELMNPQAQSYTPGDFQVPVRYKKFPTWVASFFVQQLERPSFVASMVNVRYDALSFAYSYYLDDLNQLPEFPQQPPSAIVSSLTSYFTQNPTTVDLTTLAKIDLHMQSFTLPSGSISDTSTVLGLKSNSLLTSGLQAPPSTSENDLTFSGDLTTVSSLNRDAVLMEQMLPPMYFYLTCRHTYKEVVGTFEYDRGYCFGVNEVVFLRHIYGVADDTQLYVETGNDVANVTRSDFNVDDSGNWYTY